MSISGTINASPQPTLNAQRACAEWLKACLGFGWRKSDLDFLETLWWKHHDHVGKLLTPAPQEPPQ